VCCNAGIDLNFRQHTATLHIAAHDYEFSLHKLTGGSGRNESDQAAVYNQSAAAALVTQLKSGPLTAVLELTRTAHKGSGGLMIADTLSVMCEGTTQPGLVLSSASVQHQAAGQQGRVSALHVSGDGCAALPSRGPAAFSMAIPQHPEQRSVKVTWTTKLK
jgi:hypothetical protein